MADAHRRSPGLRRALCCSFAASTQSPDRPSNDCPHPRRRPSNPLRKAPCPGSFHNSPSPTSRLGLGIIDRRRILSPGRVSPIDSDAPLGPLPEISGSVSIASVVAESEPERPDPKDRSLASENPDAENRGCFGQSGSDLKLSLKGKDGRCLVLELEPGILSESSALLAAMVSKSGRQVPDASGDSCKIEFSGLENVDVFKETIELMYAKDAARWLIKGGVSRAIDILEVSSTIMFDRGMKSCLRYIEAVPWSENEEEKLKSLFARCKFDEAISEDMLARLGPQGWNNPEDLVVHLIQSVTNGTNTKARKEMQSLVSGLLSKSSVYQKDPAGLDKERLYDICHSCLNSLVHLFEEASDRGIVGRTETKPLIERVSKQVENLNWLLEILMEKEMAEDFVHMWANQEELIKMHGRASPMIRYELSRISASVFIAFGRRKLQCHGDERFAVLRAWFEPMLWDFGWLQRCSKGLDIRMLEESLGQALLTLPLKQQQSFFEEWFRCFAEHGTGCPNLSKAFQVWWRRLFWRSQKNADEFSNT
ncbi:hypothetical protein OPV22_021438 [Ensete ventricosum]|uniref:At3g05675-like ankyrin-like domain-containing protein n=1 Tax=Ensete ventricosum TaxID=4639 RepID=A0AAV8PAV2_ENSVE|nr:hypothetical protein OPV22_021438 [Ensete ventricosum]